MNFSNIKSICNNCGKEAEVFATDYPCKYCLESGNCINKSMDIGICSELDVIKCTHCGFNELF